jgi:heterodisulfide reductase subunit A
MSEDDIRIGVFVCDCGSNIAGVVDVPDVVAYAKGLKHVVFADEGRWSCSVDYLDSMKEFIKEQNLNRVVVASCTPRTHEPLFKRTVKEAGLNPYLLEFVSIREQSSWVHMHEPEAATEKAKELIKMGVVKAALLEEGEEIKLPVGKKCLVIGGGMAGMHAALNIAAQGFKAIIVEREARLGGLLNGLAGVSYGQQSISPEELVRNTREQVERSPNIEVFTEAVIESVEGYIGNYRITVSANGSNTEVDASTIIVATGMKEIEPVGQFQYGTDPRIVTQFQLEGVLRETGKEKGGTAGSGKDISGSSFHVPGSEFPVKDVVMINCVNSRNQIRGCCNIGCPTSIKNALALKNVDSEMNIHILYRDLNVVKREGVDVVRARKQGIRFIRFSRDKYPEVEKENGRFVVRVYDDLIGQELAISSDLVVLTTALQGSETVEEIKGQIKVSANTDGFFQEAHVKLGPLDFASDGLHLCGCARSPKNLKDTLDEAIGAAMRASIPMKRGFIEAEGIVADIDLASCNNCGLCYKRCPFSAIQLDDEKRPHVIKALCKGCGLCAADCPKECISIVHYSEEQILAQVEAALEEKPEKKIIGFVCHWCALGGVDMAGVSRLQYPTNARLIRVMCSARVSLGLIQRAFDLGAAGVLVAGCEFPTCHYISGNYAAETRVKRAKRRLAKKGYDPGRLWNIWCSAADGPKFARTMREMVKELGLSS